ncbi:carboxypeptidase regulatory-like domain-containing protein [Methylobacter svalbardensis]|uniref:carboxypeptidase regulatory-like domain-containing protein n=1 Tax=Methylobacter svalbardensis TaxID=3080016 RepID=UPI0030EFA382
MKRMHLTLIFLCILFSFPAVAEQELIKPQTQGDVIFVSGGVGADEQDALQAMRAGYNLHLLFSIKGTGEYVSDVRVRIADSRGNSLMETLSEGPMLFARLKPGRYIVTVERGDQAFKQTTTVGSTKWTSLSFTWPQERID